MKQLERIIKEKMNSMRKELDEMLEETINSIYIEEICENETENTIM